MSRTTWKQLLIDEHIREDGSIRHTYLAVGSTGPGQPVTIRLLDGDSPPAQVSIGVIAALMKRYARPLEDDPVAEEPILRLGGGRSLEGYQFRAAVDAWSRDYLVWRQPGAEPMAVLGRQVAAALRFLVQPRDDQAEK